jgi:hypothetical protein
MMGDLGTDPQAARAPPRKKMPRPLRWLGWALAAPFVFVFGGPGLVVLIVVSLGYLAVASVLDLPLLYVMATFAGVTAAIGFGALARILWPRPYADSAPPELTATADSRRPKGRRGTWWMCVAALSVAVAGTSWQLMNAFSTAAENHPAGTFVALGLGALAGYAIVIAVEATAGHGLTLFPSFRIITFAPAVVIAGFATVGAANGWNDRMQGSLHDYCSYGSVTAAQMEGCLNHVTLSRIDHLDTSAARFALGSLDACLSDSGPFCARALYDRNNAPSGPAP